jgi:O-glycosyl hydrolase
MLSAAQERGVNNMVLFVNSPPVHLTRNNKAYTETCGKSNLAPEQYEAYADFLCNSLDYFSKINLPFAYVSPFNEPEWSWCRKDGQEGCPWRNEEIAAITRILNRKLEERNISTKIQIPESGLLVFANPGFRFKPGRQNEINSFFKPSGKNYLGDETHIARQVCAHSYFTEWPLKMMKSIRKRIARTCCRRDIEYWMTEYCILRKNREIKGGGRDLGMHTALYVARVMHNDLVYGNASSWQWWLGMSVADFKDGLVYANRDGSGITDSKTLWMLGNFSQFIRPGAVRMGVKTHGGNQLLLSAYKNSSGNTILVVINQSTERQYLQIYQGVGNKITAWETSVGKSLAKTGLFNKETPIPVSEKSITTLVFEN